MNKHIFIEHESQNLPASRTLFEPACHHCQASAPGEGSWQAASCGRPFEDECNACSARGNAPLSVRMHLTALLSGTRLAQGAPSRLAGTAPAHRAVPHAVASTRSAWSVPPRRAGDTGDTSAVSDGPTTPSCPPVTPLRRDTFLHTLTNFAPVVKSDLLVALPSPPYSGQGDDTSLSKGNGRT